MGKHKKYIKSGVCPICGNGFLKVVSSKNKQPVYCSFVCNSEHFRQISLNRTKDKNNRWGGGIPLWKCERCGKEFFAYHKKNMKERKFCSWRCSNLTHRRKAMAMRSRLKFENELFKLLEERGYRCIRSAGSRGPADIYAFNSNHVRIIQIKSTRKLDLANNISCFVEAVEKIRTIPCPPNCRKELWVKPLYKNWIYLIVEDLPNEKKDLRKTLKNPNWIPFMPKMPLVKR